MAQLAVSVAGAAIGNALLPGIGGMAAGAIVGSLLYSGQSAPQNAGPRVAEPDVQVASFGSPIPSTYGSHRVNGAVFWQAPPVKTTRSSGGGKGKPKAVQDTYTQSFAVAINDREVKAIRRIWADKKVIYDARESATAEAQAESAKWRKYWVLYPGTATQLPDPTIEAVDGVGNVPAFRGTAYVMFTAFPEEGFGNRIPSFSFEIETERDEVAIEPADTTVREPLRVYPWTKLPDGRPVHSYGATFNFPELYPSAPSGNDFDAVAGAQAIAVASDGGFSGTYGSGSHYSSTFSGFWYSNANPVMNVLPGGASLGDDPEYVYSMTVLRPPRIGPVPLGSVYYTEHPEHVDVYVLKHAGVISDYMIYRDVWDIFTSPPEHPGTGYALTPWGQISLGGTAMSTAWLSYAFPVRESRVPTHPPKTCRPGNPCQMPEGAAELPEDPDWCLTCAGEVIPNRDWNIIAGTAKQLCAIEYRAGRLYQNALGPVLLPGDPNYSNATFWAAEALAAVNAGLMKGDVATPVVVGDYAESTGGPTEAWQVPDPESTSLTLAEIVQSLCLATGKLTAGDIDVSELDDIVIGYTRPRRMSCRAALEPLLRAHFVGIVESDLAIAFRKMDRATSATIPAEDLGAAIGKADPVLMRATRGQEDELPTSLVLSYSAVSQDYQTGTQRAQLRVTTSGQRAAVEIPVVLTDDHARQIAERLLNAEHAARTRREFSVLRSWAAIEPCDVIEVDDGAA